MDVADVPEYAVDVASIPEDMRRFAALPWGRNWALRCAGRLRPQRPVAGVTCLADAGRAGVQACAGGPPAVTDTRWSR